MAIDRRQFLTTLVPRCCNGDSKAWKRLLDMLTPLILKICGTARLSREESLDIYGQVCYLLFTNIDKVKQPHNLVGYVARMTRREIYQMRVNLERIRRYEREFVLDKVDVTDVTPETKLLNKESSERLITALSRLPLKQCLLMKLLFLDHSEPTYSDISRKCNIPISSIGPIRARCLIKLRKLLDNGEKEDTPMDDMIGTQTTSIVP